MFDIVHARGLQRNAPTPIWFGVYPGEVTVITAEPATGKTSVALNIAASIALGQSFIEGMELEASEPQPVLYLDGENYSSVGERLRYITGRELDDIPDELMFCFDLHDLKDHEVRESLKAQVNATGAKVVVVDTVAGWFLPPEIRDNSIARDCMQFLNTLAREEHCAVIALSQMGKAYEQARGSDFRSRSMGMGATEWFATPRVVLQLSAKDSGSSQEEKRRGVCRLHARKDNAGRLAGQNLYLEMLGNDRFGLSDESAWDNGKKKEVSAKPDRIDEATTRIIELLLAHGPKNQAAILQAMKPTAGRGTVISALESMVSEGRLSLDKSPGQNKYSIPASG